MLLFIHWLQDHLLTCPSKALTGIDCPGCGMQRSFIELLKGNFKGSFYLYPALLPEMFTLSLTALHLILKFKEGAAYIKYSFIVTVAVIVISYTIKMIR
jgi:hypothetical protein